MDQDNAREKITQLQLLVAEIAAAVLPEMEGELMEGGGNVSSAQTTAARTKCTSGFYCGKYNCTPPFSCTEYKCSSKFTLGFTRTAAG